jgi:hypothetical protein
VLTIRANIKSEKDVVLMMQLPTVEDTNSSFAESVQLDMGSNTWDASSDSVKLVVFSGNYFCFLPLLMLKDKKTTPMFSQPYYIIEGSKLGTLSTSLSSGITLNTKWKKATVE